MDKNISLTIRDTDIPGPGADQVLVREVVSGTNPRDCRIPLVCPTDGNPTNQ